ncbi:MAG: MFS transporter [Egibacteraceae bacterium]
MAQLATADGTAGFSLRKVIVASSVGTMIEWYDFYIFGSLATVLATVFFPPGNRATAFLSTLATFAIGFVVRPFGAAFFGRIGDMIGRKFTFLVTISLMGGATFLVGLLPSFATAGWIAPGILIILRLLQGLALGGEYGGAAIYVAEHAPDNRRGYFTSYIQTTATLGLVISLIVVAGTDALITRAYGEGAFEAWGWRIPFLLSGVLVAVALYIRLSLKETPLFAKLKASGKTSKTPLRDSVQGGAWKLMALALLGATAGQGVVWYTGQFYALLFMQNVLRISLIDSSILVGAALVLATPFFLVFGALSDRIGRKPIILAGCALGALTFIPLFRALASAACGLPPEGGFPEGFVCEPTLPASLLLVGIVFLLVLYVTMVYGPIAAFLVELFPGRIRYTSLSLPYHIGNGMFGGIVPVVVTALAARFGTSVGLLYPIGVATLTFFVGLFFIRETYTNKIYEEIGAVSTPVPAGGSD